jgi:Protein of unknown function (DUF2938)
MMFPEVALIGVGATATLDLGAAVIRRTTGVEPLDYGLLGRWLGQRSPLPGHV